VSVPGTVGGAIIGNAGAHGGEISDNLAWVVVALPEGGRAPLTADDFAYTYRASTLKRRLALGGPAPVVVTAGFEVVGGDVADMQARAETFWPAVGRRNHGTQRGRLPQPAGRLCRRLRSRPGSRDTGWRRVHLHPARHLIVNDTGRATAAMLTLIDLMRARARHGGVGWYRRSYSSVTGHSARPTPICAPVRQRLKRRCNYVVRYTSSSAKKRVESSWWSPGDMRSVASALGHVRSPHALRNRAHRNHARGIRLTAGDPWRLAGGPGYSGVDWATQRR
jgi:hypothetical protein